MDGQTLSARVNLFSAPPIGCRRLQGYPRWPISTAWPVLSPPPNQQPHSPNGNSRQGASVRFLHFATCVITVGSTVPAACSCCSRSPPPLPALFDGLHFLLLASPCIAKGLCVLCGWLPARRSGTCPPTRAPHPWAWLPPSLAPPACVQVRVSRPKKKSKTPTPDSASTSRRCTDTRSQSITGPSHRRPPGSGLLL